MQNGKIIGAYSSSPDGVEYVTANGNIYWKLQVEIEDGRKIYDSFFCTKNAHWKFEAVFNAVGQTAPSYEDIEFEHFESLKGNNVLVRVGKDKRGYDAINLYKMIEPETVKNDPVEQDESIDQVDLYGSDYDEDDDVPF